MLTCGLALLVSYGVFFAYEYFTFRREARAHLMVVGNIIATNSGAVLLSRNRAEADHILQSLQLAEGITAAALYDDKGQLFVKYPAAAATTTLPAVPGADGYRLNRWDVTGFTPVIQNGRRLGTLYMNVHLGDLYTWAQLYGVIILGVLLFSFFLAYLLARRLQRRVSAPVQALTHIARRVSEDNTYSVRVNQSADFDELALLTDAFNKMLRQVELKTQALAHSNERVRAVIDAALNAVVVMDHQGKIIDWNERAEKIFGWSREEAIGQSLSDTIIPPYFRDAHVRGLAHYLESGQGQVFDQLLELTALRRNGEEFPVELSIRPLRESGQVTFCGFLTDITARKQAEQSLQEYRKRLESIVQRMGDAYIAIDRSWRFRYLNEKALRIMNRHKEQVLGKVVWEVLPRVLGTVFETEYRKVMNERVSSTFESYYPHYQMWLEVRAYPTQEGIAIFYSDITKYKTAEEELRMFNLRLEERVKERTQRLEALNAELESFSYSVSHDLRAPLRAIQGYINVLGEEYESQLDEEAHRIMEIITRNVRRMGFLIDDLLAFSRLGRKALMRVQITMAPMLAEVCDDLQRMEEETRDIEFMMHPLPSVYADKNAIRQVWTNLISNALKYTRQIPHARIEIGGEEQAEAVQYYIKDNGAGFDMKYYSKLFGVFQRLHGQHEFEGTGVGLAIVHRVITKHGGSVWAESVVGEGATFYLSLPKHPDVAD